MIQSAIVGLVFFFTTGLVYTILDMYKRRESALHRRLKRVMTLRESQERLAEETEEAEKKTVSKTNLPDRLPTLTRLLNRGSLGDSLRKSILRAGLRWRPAEFVALCLTTGILAGAVGLIQTRQLWLTLVLGGVGLAAPVMALWQKQEARRRQFDSQLADALTLISSSMRSGYSFQRAMQMVVDEMPQPIAEEFGHALDEMTLGVPGHEALERMVDNVRSADMELVSVAVTIQAQVGGNLAEILDTISGTIRERVRVQGEIKALTAEGRLSGVILFLLPIFLGILLTLRDPAYFQPLLDSANGKPMLIGALISQIIGGLIIRKMVTVDI